jgi:hypothetical protein
MALDWGTVTVGRIALRETFNIAETGGSAPTLSLEGQESSPLLTRPELFQVHENILGLEDGHLYPVTFTDKPERNGYYTLNNVSANLTEYAGDLVLCDWKITLTRLGSDTDIDLQSRLTGAVRSNVFSLTGEKIHAAAIGHYAYYTGATSPSTMTRTGEDGAITVYRNVPANVSPRWGADVDEYLDGRVRIFSKRYVTAGAELEGNNHSMSATGWNMKNGLVNVTPTASAGIIDVQSYDGGYKSKLWKITVGSVAPTWDSATVLRNDPEQCIVRLTASRSPGRVTLDLSLRRGSRVAEGWLQSGSSATLEVYLNSAETNTNASASGYVVATNDDADGNKFTCGSAKAFTAHADGGISKTSTTTLDFYLGAVINGSSAVSGDAATDLRNQYIGYLAEETYGVRR